HTSSKRDWSSDVCSSDLSTTVLSSGPDSSAGVTDQVSASSLGAPHPGVATLQRIAAARMRVAVILIVAVLRHGEREGVTVVQTNGAVRLAPRRAGRPKGSQSVFEQGQGDHRGVGPGLDVG